MEQEKNQFRQLHRSSANRILFGVCGGLGEYFEIDPIIFRILFVALSLGSGWGILLYILLSFVIPRDRSASSGASEEMDLRKRADGLISELRDGRLSRSRNNWLGWTMVGLGLLLLLDQMLPRGFFNWHFFWAVVIMAMGFFILTRGQSEIGSFKKEAVADQKQENSIRPGMGAGRLFFGLMFLIIGFAFLAENLELIPGFKINLGYVFKFWPIFIIVCGLSLLSKGSKAASIVSSIIIFILIFLLTISLFFPNPNWFEFWNLVSR